MKPCLGQIRPKPIPSRRLAQPRSQCQLRLQTRRTPPPLGPDVFERGPLQTRICHCEQRRAGWGALIPQSVAIFGSMEHVLQIGFAARVTVRKRPGARSKVARLSRKLKVLQKDCRSSSLRPWGFRVGAGIRFGFSGSLSGTQSLTPPGILF